MDDAERKAREIEGQTAVAFNGHVLGLIATALREARREGMMEAAWALRDIAKTHRILAERLLRSPVYNAAISEMQKIRAEECEGNAQAIERAAGTTGTPPNTPDR